MPDRALVIIPTYNEIANLPQIVPAVLLQDPRLEILVVDDNSPDGTGQLADELAAHEPRVHVLHRMSKDGLGPCLHRRVSSGRSQHDYDFIFEMDADFSHDPKFLPDFLRRRSRTPTSCSARATSRESTSSTGRSRGCSCHSAPTPMPAGSAGCRSATRPAASSAFAGKCWKPLTSKRFGVNGYAFQIEMSFRAWRKGFRLVELPIVFTDRVEGTSKMSKRIVREAIWMVWWLRLQGMLGKI